jgi:molybdopterin/thiamine biosynthesis adenylyltransferase
VCGLNGNTTEIIKNLVLAGIGSITLNDNSLSKQKDLGTQLFVDSCGKLKSQSYIDAVQELNPSVQVRVSDIPLDSVSTDNLKEYDILIVSHNDITQVKRICDIARDLNIKFYYVYSTGYVAWFFTGHELNLTPDFGLVPKKKSTKYALILAVLAYMNSADVDTLYKKHGVTSEIIRIPNDIEINPTCAIIGGFAAQEILKAMANDYKREFNFYCCNVFSAVDHFVTI